MASSALQTKPFHLFLNVSFLLLLLLLLCYSTARFRSPPPPKLPATIQSNSDDIDNYVNGSSSGCSSGLASSDAKCSYLVSNNSLCKPEGYIDYLHIFYCLCGNRPIFGYAILLFWLIILFYLLGNTAANYFCSNLQGLSKLWNLSPTIAGVTLLSLGNGAPDVFSSIVSFTASSSSSSTSTNLVGLNCILGGAFFVSSVVVGIISICTSRSRRGGVSIDKSCFLRDICFLLFVLLALSAILVSGSVNLWTAAAFTSLYFVYVLIVSMTHICMTSTKKKPITISDDDVDILDVPLLPITKAKMGIKPHDLLIKILKLLELPLYLPRRLTIPDIGEERWSKSYAVVSVTLSPMLLAFLWVSKREEEISVVVLVMGGCMGALFGAVAMMTTEREQPPSELTFPWFVGGFMMSVTWTYILAEELVSLLVSLGAIVPISPAVLGLTVLAWGNCLGDLIANVAVAVNGGASGAQVGISGCYGGPIFNTLIGLGVSFVFSAWSSYPEPMVLSRDASLFQTLGFLVAGLLWALVILPRRGMKLDRVLGVGLLLIYLCFLTLSFCQLV